MQMVEIKGDGSSAVVIETMDLEFKNSHCCLKDHWLRMWVRYDCSHSQSNIHIAIVGMLLYEGGRQKKKYQINGMVWWGHDVERSLHGVGGGGDDVGDAGVQHRRERGRIRVCRRRSSVGGGGRDMLWL
jgi:hypothetical protein